MKRVASVLILIATSATAGPYEDCIIKNMQGVQDRTAALEIRKACREKATPMKCRASELERAVSAMPLWEKFDIASKSAELFLDFDVTGARQAGYTDAEIAAALKPRCIEECARASLWQRTVGDCRTD